MWFSWVAFHKTQRGRRCAIRPSTYFASPRNSEKMAYIDSVHMPVIRGFLEWKFTFFPAPSVLSKESRNRHLQSGSHPLIRFRVTDCSVINIFVRGLLSHTTGNAMPRCSSFCVQLFGIQHSNSVTFRSFGGPFVDHVSADGIHSHARLADMNDFTIHSVDDSQKNANLIPLFTLHFLLWQPVCFCNLLCNFVKFRALTTNKRSWHMEMWSGGGKWSFRAAAHFCAAVVLLSRHSSSGHIVLITLSWPSVP